MMRGGALVSAIVAAVLFAPRWDGAYWIPAGVFALLTVMFSALIGPRPGSPPLHIATNVPSKSPRWWVFWLGCAVLAALVLLQQVPPPEAVQFALLALGIGLVVFGLRDGASATPGETAHVLPLALVMLFAFAVRITGVDDTIRIQIDEFQLMGPIGRMRIENVPVLGQINNVFTFTFLYPYLHSPGSAIFGHNFLGLRAMSALFGAMTVLPLYALGRHLWPTHALTAALIFAALPLNVHFSRVGMPNATYTFFGVTAVALAVRAVRTGHGWALAGAALGLTHYFHDAARLLFTPLVMVWLWLVFITLGEARFTRQRPYTTRAQTSHIRGLGRYALAAIAVALPVYLTWATTDAAFGARLTVAARNATTEFDRLENLARAGLLLVSLRDTEYFYGGTQPVIPMFAVAFALIGVGRALARGRAGLLPLLWIGGGIVGSGLLLEVATGASRYVALSPALAVILAFGVGEVAVWVGNVYTGNAARPSRFTAERWEPGEGLKTYQFALTVLLAVGLLTYFFGVHLPRYETQSRNARGCHDIEDAMFRLLALPDGTHAHVIHTIECNTNPLMTLLNYFTYRNPPPLNVLLSTELDRAYLDRLPGDVGHAFFVEPEDAASLAHLTETFPNAVPRFSPYDVPVLWQYALIYVEPQP